MTQQNITLAFAQFAIYSKLFRKFFTQKEPAEEGKRGNNIVCILYTFGHVLLPATYSHRIAYVLYELRVGLYWEMLKKSILPQLL